MVYTRSKIKKFQNTFKPWLSQEDSDEQWTESGALIGSNDDLLTQILLRLPVTSILRFKSVSKHWQCLLSHRHFTLRYDSLFKSPGLFASHGYVPFHVQNPTTPPIRRFHPIRGLDFYFDRYGIRIIQSCNGLLLCWSHRCSPGARIYYVFNPTTKQFKLIPSVPGGYKARKTICFMGLAFHQTDCAHYKVVCIRKIDRDRELFQIQIYSSDTGRWKISIESFSTQMGYFIYGVYLNGAFYWAPTYRNHLYFDIEVERLQTLPLPAEMVSYETLTSYFGESRGHFHLILYNYHENHDLHLNVYEMASDRSGWFVKYQLDLDELACAFPEMLYGWGYDFKVVDVVRGEKEEDTFVVLRIPGKIITFNVHDNSFKQIIELTNEFYDGYSRFHRYTEALASL